MKKKYLLIDIGGSFIKVMLISAAEKEVIYKRYKTNKKNIIKQILNIIDKAICNYKITNMGIAIPGAVDTKKGIVLYAINLNLYNFSLKKLIEEKYNIKTIVISDRDSGLIGTFINGKSKNVIGVSVGTGIACSIIMNGKLFVSSYSHAPEIGHSYITDDLEAKCFCGKVGCLNAISGCRAISEKLIKEAKIDNNEPMRIALKEKNKKVDSILNKAIFYLAKQISNLCNTIEPEEIIIWGGGSYYIEKYHQKLTEQINNSLHFSMKNNIKITISEYREKSALYGLKAIIDKKFIIDRGE